MMHSQEPRVSSSQDSLCLNISSSVSALVKRLNSSTTAQATPKNSTSTNEEEKKVLAILPWLPQFSMLSRFSLGSRNIKQLKRLMSTYLRYISEMVRKSLKKTVRAAKIKKNMSEVLVMFHMMYVDIREPFEQGSYLDTMSDLVAMYLDMEIRASKRMKETLPNVVSRLTMYLYILLGNSETHILDTILKTRLFTKHHEKICAPIIGKVVSSAKTSSLQTMLYVRYLLVYKLWKRVVSSGAERIRINKLAVQRLVTPTSLLEKSAAAIFISVLPKKPKTKKNTTMFFMQAKFDLKKSVQAFLKLLKDSKLSDFPAVTANKPIRFSSPPSFFDKENNLVCGDDTMSPFNDIWSSISSIDINFSEQTQESPVIIVKKETEADVSSTQKSPKTKKHKKIKGKTKLFLNSRKEKKKRKKNKEKSVKACSTLSLNCIKPSGVCSKESKKKSDKLFHKENSVLSVVDLASNLRALSTVDSSVTPDSVSGVSSLSPREVQSLQYESLSSTTPMESLPVGIPTPPASLPPPVAEQIPATPIRTQVTAMTTSFEALLQDLPRKREQPDSDDCDREVAEVKCDVRELGNIVDSSARMEVGEVDSKPSVPIPNNVNSNAAEEESSGQSLPFVADIKGDMDEEINRPPSRDSSVICLGSNEMDTEDNLAALCMDIGLEEEQCLAESTFSVQAERTVAHEGVQCVEEKTLGSGVCVIQNISDIVKVDSGGAECVGELKVSPVHSPAGHVTGNISLCEDSKATSNSVISVVGVPIADSLCTELAMSTKADVVLAESPLDEPPAIVSDSVGDIVGTEDSSSRDSVTIIDASDTVIANGDINVAGIRVLNNSSFSSAVRGDSLQVPGSSDSSSELQTGKNIQRTPPVTFDDVLVPVPCTSNNVAMLPSDNLPVVDDDQSSDDVQIICEHVSVTRQPVKNESRMRDDFTRLQKDFFNSAEYDSDVEILEGIAKDTREDLTLNHERATIARVEHRNELVVEQVLSGQFPVNLDLDGSQATLADDLNFCSETPESPPINGGTLHFNEISPINNKSGTIEFGLYEKTSDKIQAGSTDPWLTDSANSFSYNFSRFSPVQETAPMDFLDDDADLSDDAYSAYGSHVPKFSEGGKRRSEEFRTKGNKEGTETVPDKQIECNGIQSSATTEESRTTAMPTSPLLQKESEQSVSLCSRKPSSEKPSVRFPQVNTVRHFTSSLPCDQQEDRSDGDGDSVVEPPCKVTRTSKPSLNEEADYFTQISSVQLEHLSEETMAAQQPSLREGSPAPKALDEPKELTKQAPKAVSRGRGRPARGRGRGSKSVACVRKASYSSSSDDDEVVRQAVKAIRLANLATEKNQQKASTPVHFVRRSTRQHSMYNKPPVVSPDIEHSGDSSDNADTVPGLGLRKRPTRGRKSAASTQKQIISEPVNNRSKTKESTGVKAKEKVSPVAKKSRRRQY